MLIWINGAFGAGKSTVAAALAARLPGSLVVDPEQIGFLLRRMLPRREQPGDFQDLPLWRRLGCELLDGVAAGRPGPVVVPMTLAEPAYFDQLVGELRRRGHPVCHFTLVASPETLRRRLRWRLARPAARRWIRERNPGVVERLAAPLFAAHLTTDGRRPAELVAEILDALPLGAAETGTPVAASPSEAV